MRSETDDSRMHEDGWGSEWTWERVSSLLYPLAKRLVFSAGIPSWHGQEDDIIDDLVQETMRRVFEYTLRVERGEVPPITSHERLAAVILQNYFQDLRRHDHRLTRLVRSPDDGQFPEAQLAQVIDPAEAAVESIFEESLFQTVANVIAHFPERQRTALLIDLANRMLFETEPTALQQAFLEEGIRLEDYRQPLPTSPTERARHMSLVTLAYKRLAQFPHVHQYLADTGGAADYLGLTESSLPEKQRKVWNEQRGQLAGEVKGVEAPAKGISRIHGPQEGGQAQQIATRVEHLREPYRKAIDLHLLQGHTYPQMAQELGLPIGTVKSHVSRGMKLLQRLGA